MVNPINFILSIIEQPKAKKPYEDFSKYLGSINRTEEANAMLLLAEKHNNEFNNTSSNSE